MEPRQVVYHVYVIQHQATLTTPRSSFTCHVDSVSHFSLFLLQTCSDFIRCFCIAHILTDFWMASPHELPKYSSPLSLCSLQRMALLSHSSPVFGLSHAFCLPTLLMLVIHLLLVHFLPLCSMGFFPLVYEHWLLYRKQNFLQILVPLSAILMDLTFPPHQTVKRCFYTCLTLPLPTRCPSPPPNFPHHSAEALPHRSVLLNPVSHLGSHLLPPIVLAACHCLTPHFLLPWPLGCSQLSPYLSDLVVSDSFSHYL